MELPAGFELDAPNTTEESLVQQAPIKTLSSSLPEGFTVDEAMPVQKQEPIDPIDQHRPQEIDDETWNDVKSRIPKFLNIDTKSKNKTLSESQYGELLKEDVTASVPSVSIPIDLGEAKFKAVGDETLPASPSYEKQGGLQVAKAPVRPEIDAITELKRGMLAQTSDFPTKVKNAKRVFEQGGYKLIGVKPLEEGFASTRAVYKLEKDGNEFLLDEDSFGSIINELAGDPASTAIGIGTLGIGKAIGLGAIGNVIDQAISKAVTGEELTPKQRAVEVGKEAAIFGTAEAVVKGLGKGIDLGKKLSQRAWTLYKTGDIKGAVKVVKDDYKLSDSDIDALFKNVSKDVEGLDELQGDDLLRAKLLAVVQQQEQGEGLITEAIKKTPKGAMETSKEIAARAKEVLKYAESMGSKPSAIKKSVQSYEKAVGENYGEVRGLIDEALPNYKPDLDLASFSGTLKELNTRVIDPTVKEKITNLAESLSSQKVETVGDLIETRQLFNRFYGKNQSHFESKVDKEALMSIQKSIDSKIDEAMSTLPDEVSTGLKNAFTDAKKQYEEMFKVRDTATYISIFGKKGKAKGKSEEQIGKALVKYSKAEDNDLEVVLSKLSPVQRVKSEFSIINELLSTSMGKTQAKSIDFNKLLEGINASKNTFKSDEAKQFIKNIEEFDKKFGKDVGLQKATEGVVAKEMNSIATSVIGKTKMLLASIQFKAIQRLAMSDEGRRLSLQKSIEMALQKSRTPREFFFEASKIKGMPDSERIALKKAVKDIGEQEAMLKEQATIQATKNEESIAKAKADKEARVAKTEAEARQRWETAKAEKKITMQAQKAKEAAEVPIGGSEDEAKQAVRNVFAKTNKPKLSKADVAEIDKQDLADEAETLFAKGAPELLSGTIAGVEQDERGNITLDPAKFVMGVLGVSSIRRLNKAYKNSPKTQAKVEKALKSLAKDSTRVAGDMIEKINKQIGLNIEPRIVADVKVPTTDSLSRLLSKKGEFEGVGKEVGTIKKDGISTLKSEFGSYRYVMSKNGEPIAALQVMSRDGKVGEIANIFTKQSERRKGLALELYNKAKSDFTKLYDSKDLTPDGKKFVEGINSKVPHAEMKKMNRQELELLDVDILDKEAFGVNIGDRLKLKTKEISPTFTDIENAEYKFEKGGTKWVRSVDLSEPIEIYLKDGKYFIEDGHHRWFAANKLNKEIDAIIVDIKNNPIDKILGE